MAYFAASIDSPDTNRAFAEALELDYPILSDPDKDVAKQYGVLRGFGLYTARHTFYIDRQGEILFVDRDVSAGSAGEDVVARLHALEVPRR